MREPYAKIQGVDPYGEELIIAREGPTIAVTAGSGYESGTTYLTPPLARLAAQHLIALAETVESHPETS